MVTLVIKDSTGRFWIGTGDGLHVSTGSGFEKIKIASDGFVKTGLRIPRKAYVDANGRVYIGYEGGVFMFQNVKPYLHNNKVLRILKWPEFLGEDDTYVYLMLDYSDLVLIPKKAIDEQSTDSKIILQTNYFKFTTNPKILSRTNRKLGYFYTNDTFYQYKISPNHQININFLALAGKKSVSALSFFKDGTLAFAAQDEIYKLDPWKKEIRFILKLPIKQITALHIDEKGNYWIGAENGKLILVDAKTGEQHVNPDFFPIGISIRFIQSIDQKIL